MTTWRKEELAIEIIQTFRHWVRDGEIEFGDEAVVIAGEREKFDRLDYLLNEWREYGYGLPEGDELEWDTWYQEDLGIDWSKK
jgi:hypothetical protein